MLGGELALTLAVEASLEEEESESNNGKSGYSSDDSASDGYRRKDEVSSRQWKRRDHHLRPTGVLEPVEAVDEGLL